jgi:hypothetical protein
LIGPVALGAVALSTAGGMNAPATASQPDPVIGAAGDIACDPADPNFDGGNGDATHCGAKATSDLLLGIHPSAVLTLGDNQYEQATLANFQRSYEPTWGRLKTITFPALGNHEGGVAESGQGYCAYFGPAAHCNAGGTQGAAGFYSWDLGAWHMIALNSNCVAAGGCDVGSLQYLWLRVDLATHPAACTLAYWHHPRWSSGFGGSNPMTQALWQLLSDAGADVVLTGHSHDYERFAPQDASGRLDRANGIREFVVGTGGAELTGLSETPAPNSEISNNQTFGILRLTLHPASYDWAFVPTRGAFTDAGSTSCHPTPHADTRPPTAPGQVVVARTGPTSVALTWSPSSDDVGVAGYAVWRAPHGTPLATIATIDPAATAYTDVTAPLGATLDYAVTAVDAAGNVSPPSNTATVTMTRATSGKRCVVPRVRGFRLAGARAALVRAHCRPGRVSHAFSWAVRRERVVSTLPRRGARLHAGAPVRIVLSRGHPRR